MPPITTMPCTTRVLVGTTLVGRRLSTKPPSSVVTLLVTVQSGGTWISMPPQNAKTSTVALSLSMRVSARSSLMPPITAVRSAPRNGPQLAARHQRERPHELDVIVGARDRLRLRRTVDRPPDQRAADEQQQAGQQQIPQADVDPADAIEEYPAADGDQHPAPGPAAAVVRAADHGDADSNQRQRPQAAQHVTRVEPAEIVSQQDRADANDDDADHEPRRDQRLMTVAGSGCDGAVAPVGLRGLVIEIHAAHPPEAPGVWLRRSRLVSRTRKLSPEAMTKIGQAVPQPRSEEH